jgi:hypothetical protein
MYSIGSTHFNGYSASPVASDPAKLDSEIIRAAYPLRIPNLIGSTTVQEQQESQYIIISNLHSLSTSKTMNILQFCRSCNPLNSSIAQHLHCPGFAHDGHSSKIESTAAEDELSSSRSSKLWERLQSKVAAWQRAILSKCGFNDQPCIQNARIIRTRSTECKYSVARRHILFGRCPSFPHAPWTIGYTNQ